MINLDIKKIRPLQHLNAAVKLYQNSPKLIDEFRSSKGKDLPKWPAWCFLPMAAWYAIVCHENGVDRLDIRLIADISKLSATMTWRYSQGIYQFDHDFLNALTNSVIKGPIPSEVLYRLPEWCIYIQTPELSYLNDIMYGFFAHLEWDANTHKSELRLLLDCEKNLIPIAVHLGPWTITEAFDRALSVSKKNASELKIDLNLPDNFSEKVSEFLNKIISTLLYISSDEPEIENDRVPGMYPARPEPKRTKNGWRMFPPNKPTLWIVGKEIGKKLRKANFDSVSNTSRTVKPHIRRGHWHGYWTGPRDEHRKFIYKWISPITVNV